MSEELPKQVDYRIKHPDPVKYRYLQVNPVGNVANPLLMSNASQTIRFAIPTGTVVNMARSKLSYTLAVNVPGAAGRHNIIADDTFQICQQLQYVTNQGVVLADVPFANRYLKIADKLYTRKEDFLSRGMNDISHPCNVLVEDNPICQLSNLPNPNYYGIPNNVNEAFINYREPQYFNIGADNSVSGLAKSLPLADIGRGTLLEQDKDIYLEKETYLVLQTAPVDTFAGYTTDTGVLQGNTAFCAANAVGLANLVLYLAVQENSVISDAVVAKFNSSEGINLRTDYITAFQNSLTSAVSNVTLVIPQQDRTKPKRIISTTYLTSQAVQNNFDCENINGYKVNSYTTQLNSKPLQNQLIDCRWSTPTTFSNTDWLINERYLKGSVYEGIPMYQYNWCHIDEFDNEDDVENNADHQNDDVGHDLGKSGANYLLALQTPNAAASPISSYSFCILSRELHIGKDYVNFKNAQIV